MDRLTPAGRLKPHKRRKRLKPEVAIERGARASSLLTWKYRMHLGATSHSVTDSGNSLFAAKHMPKAFWA